MGMVYILIRMTYGNIFHLEVFSDLPALEAEFNPETDSIWMANIDGGDAIMLR